MGWRLEWLRVRESDFDVFNEGWEPALECAPCIFDAGGCASGVRGAERFGGFFADKALPWLSRGTLGVWGEILGLWQLSGRHCGSEWVDGGVLAGQF